MSEAPEIFDRHLLRRRKQRAAPCAGKHDFLLSRVGEDFAGRLAGMERYFTDVLELGAYNGKLGHRLVGEGRRYVGQLVSLEACQPMLYCAAGRRVVADEEAVPFADTAFDLVVSGLSLHLANDLPGVFARVYRILRPGGLFMAAVLGSQSLYELREAFMLAEEEEGSGISPRVAPFADVRNWGNLLLRAGFASPVADSDVLDVTYASPLHLMRELRGMGAGNALLARSRKPLPRKVLSRACEIYAERHSHDARIKASFEIITLTGWKPSA
jgi:SAM-dependent methyltransferase